MVGRTVLVTLEGSAPHQRLQVALGQQADGRLTIDLREQHYAEGIGWFDQRTMELDPRQFRQLQAVLGSKTAEPALAEARDEPRATIPFPGPSSRRTHRPAVGEGR
jgi:hypothetical protein